ncbi:MAG TPA: hypothetical protein VG389_10230 [Myxococcota bacterium]|jgi:hypothetical protein|nr:hypothetical protein [Myxococcota bacterium]
MGHVVEALVVRALALPPGGPALPARAVTLRQGLALLPLTDALVAHAVAAFAPAAADDHTPDPPYTELPKLRGAVLRWMRALVGDAEPFAYLETDYAGARARQAAAVWRGAALTYGPRRANIGPINEALALLGVHGVGTNDAFDAVGLARHRTTADWLSAP